MRDLNEVACRVAMQICSDFSWMCECETIPRDEVCDNELRLTRHTDPVWSRDGIYGGMVTTCTAFAPWTSVAFLRFPEMRWRVRFKLNGSRGIGEIRNVAGVWERLPRKLIWMMIRCGWRRPLITSWRSDGTEKCRVDGSIKGWRDGRSQVCVVLTRRVRPCHTTRIERGMRRPRVRALRRRDGRVASRQHWT